MDKQSEKVMEKLTEFDKKIDEIKNNFKITSQKYEKLTRKLRLWMT